MKGLEIILILLAIVGFIYLIWKLFVCVADMARKRHRDVSAWIIISLLINPIYACIILYILGDKRH